MVLQDNRNAMPAEGDIAIETPSFHDDFDHLYCAHLPVHENLGKKRKLSSPNHFKNKRIQRIHDTTTSPPWTPLYSSTLEQEALQYIHKFYCKDCQMDHQNAERARQQQQQHASPAAGEAMTTSSADEATVGTTTVTSVTEIKQEPVPPVSPQQTTDEGSIMQTLDKNKESLKRKLMMRRSLNELVDQGIYPPPKTPPAFMEQRKSLERAKIGDSLRFKISHRPDRQQLVQQHILEDTNIDPSLHERQRLLKKARLTDSLNDKLSHRPGILELVQGNILQTDGKLQQLIKEGSLSFDKTTDLTLTLPPNEDSKSSDEAFSPDQTDDSNISDISSPPIPQAPELPTSFAKSLPFSAQINFSEESKVTLPSSSSPAFTIPQHVTTIGAFPLSGGSAVSGNVVSPRNNVTVTTINNNNNNKARPKKPKPKPQPKAKVIKFHEYKGPPNVVKSSQPVSSTVAAAVNVSNPVQAVAQGTNPDNTPYHILLQQQQLYLQWQLEFSQKNRNTVQTVLLPAQKELSSSIVQAATSPPISLTASSSSPDIPAVTMTTQSPQQTVFTVTPSTQHGQPPTPVQHIRISSPVLQIQQEAPVGQPQPQLNPNITPVPNKQVVKKPPTSIVNGPPKQYASLEEMKVAELKAELKKRNLPVSGPKPQLIDRLKPYADSIIKIYSEKSPSSSVTSPGSSVMSVLSPSSVKTTSSPLPFSVMSPPSSVMSPQSVVASSKTFVISPGNSSSSMTVPVAIVTSSSMFSPPGSVQSTTGSVSSPGSVHSVSNTPATSPHGCVSRPNSVLSRQGSVMSPLGSMIDETLTTNAVSPLPSIQSMQSAVSVSNMNLMPDDLSNPFSPPQSPLFIDSVMTPLSPDLMEIPISSPQDINSASINSATISVSQNFSNSSHTASEQGHNQPVSVNTMEQSRPPSVLSLAPSDMENMDVDLDLTQSLNGGMSVHDNVGASVGGSDSQSIPPPPPLPQVLNKVNFVNQSREVQAQQQLLQQIQSQLHRLQERQQQQLFKEQAQHMAPQMSQEELLRQQQEKIEKLQTQLEESQLRLQLQQLQHQQLQQQQKQLQQLQQQQQLHQQLQKQAAQQHDLTQAVKQQQHQQQQGQTPDMNQGMKPPQTQHQPDITTKQHIQKHVPSSSPATSQQQQQQQQQVSRGMTSVLTMAVPAQSTPGPTNTTHVHPVVTSPSTVAQPPVVAQPVPASSSATTAPLIFSLPNGNKPPMLTNLPPNMKQIQIPAQLLQAVQNQQGVPTVIVTQNTKLNSTKGKTGINPDLFKNQGLNQTLDLGGGKSLIAVTNTQTGAQQFIITTAPQHKPGTSSSSLNGITQPPVQKMATSLPTSPVNTAPQQPVSRTSSNPFYIPMKEPPKYDDVVKQKPKKAGVESTSTNNPGIKSQTMDDVLEILIRSGELPESAAQEPPPTPKTVTQTSTVTTMSVSTIISSSSTSSASTNIGQYHQSSDMSPASTNMGQYHQSSNTSPGSTNIGQYHQSSVFSSAITSPTGYPPPSIASTSVTSGTDSNKNVIYFPMEEPGTSNLQFDLDSVKSEIKSESQSPQPCRIVTTAAGPSTSDVTNSDDLFDLNEVINSDLTSMDWTSDTGFGDLDLTDTAQFSTGMDLMPNDNTLLSIPMAHSPHRSNHGSEPDLANLELGDMDTNTNMQIDIPDWLDVIMPTTGLTPLSASAPISFPSDPILTPTTHQEVLDLFSLEETDLNTPSDLNSGTSNGISSLDKLLGATSG